MSFPDDHNYAGEDDCSTTTSSSSDSEPNSSDENFIDCDGAKSDDDYDGFSKSRSRQFDGRPDLYEDSWCEEDNESSEESDDDEPNSSSGRIPSHHIEQKKRQKTE